jgi:outer membrane protein assembly factor BamB
MWRSLALGAVVVVCIAFGSLALPAAEDRPTSANWPQFRGPHRDDHSPDKGLLKEWPKDGPPVVWKTKGLGTGFSTVSVVDGQIFTMGDREIQDNGKTTKVCCVIALKRADGSELWSAKIGAPGGGGGYNGPRSSPTVDGDRVYALGQFGDLVCLDKATGREVWRKNLPKDFKGGSGGWSYTESPLVDGQRLVCTPGGNQHTIVALDKTTGEMIPGWKGAVPGGSQAGYSSIVISEGAGTRQYVQLLAAGVVGIAAADGAFLWRYDKLGNNTANVPTPIVRSDYVWCSAGYNKGGALLKLTGTNGQVKAEELYYNKELRNRHGGVVLIGEYVYGDRDQNGQPFCAEFLSGKVTTGWLTRPKTQGGGSAAVTYADGHLYFRYDNGWVALVEANPTRYRETGAFKIPNSTHNSWPHPVVVGGHLYLREQDMLWCYDVKQHQ